MFRIMVDLDLVVEAAVDPALKVPMVGIVIVKQVVEDQDGLVMP